NLAKRIRTNTISDFNKEVVLLKVLTFTVDNNISFRALDLESFQDLIRYFKPNAPTINRKNIKELLKSTFDRFISTFNTDLKVNIESYSTFYLTFDI
ncbi:hypothetical protein QBC39DRAFT_270633, partial [Podospora conica]